MKPPSVVKGLWVWGPVVVYLALIFYFSSLSDVSWAKPYPDHLLHAVEFFGLSILMARALNGGLQRAIPSRTLLLAFLFCLLYAVSDEIHQIFVPNRFSDLADIVSDMVGIVIGLAALHLMQRMVLRRHVA